MGRLAAIAALVALVGCSPTGGDCFPSTCDGCCSADGQCLSGETLTACGLNANSCVDCSSSGLLCQSGQCRAPSVSDAGASDAGVDAGTEDAGPGVFVTLRYWYAPEPTMCPQVPDVEDAQCVVPLAMSKAKFDSIRLEYAAACVTTQPTSDSYEIDCGACTKGSDMCAYMFDGGSPMLQTRAKYACPEPAYTTPGACAWTP